jgi:drug/metabolite transporter (DMT)-like permease
MRESDNRGILSDRWIYAGRLLRLVGGTFCCATAVIMIKASSEPPALLAAWRTLLAALILSPVCVRDMRRERVRLSWRSIRPALLPGVFLGVHFVTWIIGARMTPAAHSSLIVNMVPVVMPVLLYAYTREALTRAEIGGTLLAMAGLVLLGWSDLHVSAESFAGDLVCFGSMLFFAWYLALARRNRGARSLWLYIVPLYVVAGLTALGPALLYANPIKAYQPVELALIAGLAIVPTVFGHTILNRSMQVLRGQTVALTNQGQFVFAAFMAYFIFGETPSLPFYPAVAFILAGAVIVIRAESRTRLSSPATAPTEPLKQRNASLTARR